MVPGKFVVFIQVERVEIIPGSTNKMNLYFQVTFSLALPLLRCQTCDRRLRPPLTPLTEIVFLVAVIVFPLIFLTENVFCV